MNRDPQSLFFAASTLVFGLLSLFLTASWAVPIVVLVLGTVGLVAALIRPSLGIDSEPEDQEEQWDEPVEPPRRRRSAVRPRLLSSATEERLAPPE
ncbi:hypothetical protein ACWIGI_31040 [Nocardia sp. NPDC055321]